MINPQGLELLREENAVLRAQIEWLKKQLFGAGKSEKLDRAQLLLKLSSMFNAPPLPREARPCVPFQAAWHAARDWLPHQQESPVAVIPSHISWLPRRRPEQRKRRSSLGQPGRHMSVETTPWVTPVLTVAGTILAGLVVQSYSHVFRRWIEERDARDLEKRIGRDEFTATGFKKAALRSETIYVRPDCQDSDPSGEPDNLAKNRRKLFTAIYELLGPPLKAKCILMLADSGMGKSEFLQQFYRHHWSSQKRLSRFRLVVVLLNSADANALIERVPIEERDDTVLFLDALDEDNAAIENLAVRFRTLLNLTSGFRAVLITCRTQFLAGDKDQLPQELSIPTLSGPAGLSHWPENTIWRLYLSRLSDRQVAAYIREKFSFLLHPLLRLRAHRTAERFQDLVARPLILTFVQDLIKEKTAPKFTYQVYGLVVNAWLAREERKRKLTSSKDDLLRFSELFAGELFSRGVPGLPSEHLSLLATKCGIKLEIAEIRERSLLAYLDGNWKFSHRSIMEYLLVQAVADHAEPPQWVFTDRPWTDMMQRFAWEMTLDGKSVPGANVGRVRLSEFKLQGVDFSKLRLDGGDVAGVDFSSALGVTLHHAVVARADRSTRWPVRVLKAHTNDVTGCALLERTKEFLSSSLDGKLLLWRDAALHQARESKVILDLGQSPGIKCCAVNEEKRVFVAASGSEVYYGSLENEKHRLTLHGHSDEVTACAILPDGNTLITASADSTVRLWNTESARCATIFTGLSWRIQCCAVATAARAVVAGSSDGHVGMWSLDTGELLQSVAQHQQSVECCSVDPNGTIIVSGSRDRTLLVWEPNANSASRKIGQHEATIYTVALLLKSHLVVSGSTDETIRIWDLRTGAQRAVLRGHTNRVSCCAVNEKETRLLTGSIDKTLRVWF